MNISGDDSEHRCQVESFIEICQLVRRIQEICTEIAITGYINPLNLAYEIYAKKAKAEKLQVHFWNSSEFDIYIAEDHFEQTCVERFREMLKLMDSMLVDVKNNSIKILNSEKDYFLNFWSGAQYNTVLNYLTNNIKQGENDKIVKQEAISLLDYAFGQLSRKDICAQIPHENKIQVEVKDFNTLENLKNNKILSKAKDFNQLKYDDNTELGFEYFKIDFNHKKYISYTKLVSKKDNFVNLHRLVLHCNMYTTKGQIGSFVQRALFDMHKTQYYVFDLDLTFLSCSSRTCTSRPRL